MTDTREPIYCDCCGKEVLAWRVNGKIIVKDRRHGEKHTLSLDIRGELEKQNATAITSSTHDG